MAATAILLRQVNRRQLLKAGAAAAGGLVISIALPPLRARAAGADAQAQPTP